MRFFFKFIFPVLFFFALGEFMGFPKGLEILKLGDFRTDGDGDVLRLPPQKMQHIRLKVDEIVQMSKASDIHLLTCLQVSLSLSLSVGMKSYSKPRLQNRVSNIWGIRILLHIAYLIANTKSS